MLTLSLTRAIKRESQCCVDRHISPKQLLELIGLADLSRAFAHARRAIAGPSVPISRS